jgi:hypothetical protein
MPEDPRAVVERTAHELLRNLTELTTPPRLRVTGASGELACMILVWGTSGAMPTLSSERGRAAGGRAECRADILSVIRAAGRAMTHKQLVRALREAGKPHGPGTVMKALAELTRARELVNPKDKKGYRLASWPTPGTPPLF